MAGSGRSHAFDRAHDALLGRSDLQFDFPAYQQPQIPDWLRWLGQVLGEAAPALKWIFWGAVALAAAMAIYLIVRALLRLQLPVKVTREEKADLRQEWRPTAEQARILLADADSLAAAGRYEEAVHLLLLRSVQDIDERRPQVVRPAHTSREIVSLSGLPQSVRDAFAEIARVVERSRFGGRPVTADDYARCRRDYERFAFPDLWREAA